MTIDIKERLVHRIADELYELYKQYNSAQALKRLSQLPDELSSNVKIELQKRINAK